MAENTQVYIVGGVGFPSAEEAKAARMELNRMQAIDKKLDYTKPESVASVYEKARENYVFRTPIGIYFMMRLHDYLEKNQYEGIADKPVLIAAKDEGGETGAQARDEMWKARLEQANERADKENGKYKRSVMCNVLLALLVAALFLISMTGKNPTILNYRTKVINEYTQWQKDLEEREEAVRLKEAEVGISGEPADG